MKQVSATLLCGLWLLAGNALAWSNHALATYRAFEHMPQVVQAAPVEVESLESFLREQEPGIERLLARQEVWAQANLALYPARPAALEFKTDPARTDVARKQAFLRALRVAPNSRFALFLRSEPSGVQMSSEAWLEHDAVSTLPQKGSPSKRFVPLQAGDQVSALSVVATATEEPDFGLDLNLWDDSPSKWGMTYGFGNLPFGNPALDFATQAPFHMGFFHEDGLIYKAAPFVSKTFPLLRIHQFSTLATLALRTGHPYWGWRFAGLALHYVQDLTQPYHASLAPGNSTFKLISINLLAMAGWPRWKNEMIVLLSNRHLAFEKYSSQLLGDRMLTLDPNSIDRSLGDASSDHSYPAWSDRYPVDVVSRQAHGLGKAMSDLLVRTMPHRYVSDPAFDFGVQEDNIDLATELGAVDADNRNRLDTMVAALLGNFGAHSRNLLRAILNP